MVLSESALYFIAYEEPINHILRNNIAPCNDELSVQVTDFSWDKFGEIGIELFAFVV